MEGDKSGNEKNKKDKPKGKTKSDDEVKISLLCTRKYSKTKILNERLRPCEAGHNLNTVDYNFRHKYKASHDREYVHYHRDYAAYNYRGYEIKEPKVKICPAIDDSKDQPLKWVQYLSHAERHSRLPPRMYYYPNDNTFVQITLMSLLLMLAITLGMSLVALYSAAVQDMFLEPYDFSWVPAAFGIVCTLYMVFCTACARVFPISLILLVVNLICTCWMCMYVTSVHETRGIILSILCVMFIVLCLIIFALCDFDFRRVKFLFLTGILSFLFSYCTIWIIAGNFDSWLPDLPRRENMMIFGVVVYCLCMIFLLQLIISDRTLQLADDEYTLGTFMLYMCVPCLFMKLVAHMGLYVENR